MTLEEDVAEGARELDRVGRRIAPRFGRVEPRRRAMAYLRGLLAPVERKNGWQLAEAAGDGTPDAMQDFLSRMRWDADAVRDDLQAYVVEPLGDPGAALVPDETGFVKNSVYGSDSSLRRDGEHRSVGYVLTVTSAQRLGGRDVASWAEAMPADAWQRLSAGDGAKGPRLYDWAYAPYQGSAPLGWQKGLLVRRSIAEPDDLTFCLTLAPPDTELATLVRAAADRTGGASPAVTAGLGTPAGARGRSLLVRLAPPTPAVRQTLPLAQANAPA